MFWPRVRQALVGGAILVALAAVLPAGAATSGRPAPIKHVHVSIPLPRARHGTIRMIDVAVKMPAGMRVTGNPFLVSVTNGTKVPCYIRAAGVLVPKQNGLWHLYVAINAPKGLVACRSPAAASIASTLNVDVGTGVPLNQFPSSVKLTPGDRCKGLRDEDLGRIYIALLVASNAEAEEAVHRSMVADRFCKR